MDISTARPAERRSGGRSGLDPQKNPAPVTSDRRQACHENHPTRSFLLSGNFLKHQMPAHI